MTVDEFMKKYGPRYYDVSPETLPKYQSMKADLEEMLLHERQSAIGFMVQREGGRDS